MSQGISTETSMKPAYRPLSNHGDWKMSFFFPLFWIV